MARTRAVVKGAKATARLAPVERETRELTAIETMLALRDSQITTVTQREVRTLIGEGRR
jgi:hypothetical protein